MWLQSDNNFIRFDEKSNTYDSLEKVLFFLKNVKEDLNYWKWVIFALHNALYGAMILSLQGTNPARVIQIDDTLKERIKKRYNIHNLDINNTQHVGKVWLHGKLISFTESFNRIQKEKFMKMNVGSKTFQTRDCHKRSIKWLNNELRNPFAHFSPRGWSIAMDDIKNILNPCFEIIEFCLFKSGNVLLDKQEIKLFKNITTKLQKHITSY